VLRLEPVPEHVTFDTMLELTSGEYEVKGEPGAG
jgi:predicted component of type VI protein secretion system